jgi:hypothetical protein
MPYETRSDRSSRFEVSVTKGYSDEEDQLLRAAVKYRQKHKLIFLTATDYLKILKCLGYEQRLADPA